jgi:hypothetical protein
VQGEETLTKLAAIAEHLQREFKEPAITHEALADLLAQFLQFMEDTAGMNVSSHYLSTSFHVSNHLSY